MIFDPVINWAKGVWNRMFGKEIIKKAVGVEPAISSPMAEAIQLWSRMYENKSPWLSETIKSLNLGATVAAELAATVTIEMQVIIEGSRRADYLSAEFDRTVLDKLQTEVEYGIAKGGLVFKPYIDGGKLAVDFIQADQFYPVRFDSNGDLLAAVFVDQEKIGDKFYTRLEHHDYTDTQYRVVNKAYQSTSRDTLGSSVELSSVARWAELQPEAYITDVDRPLFAYFKFPLANTIDTTSPLGVSGYSRAVDLIKQADEIWSNLLWEFESGKRALYVDTLAFKKDEKTGNPILPDKRLYRALNTSGNANEDLFEEWSPEFREASIRAGLDAVLKKIEYACGLAYGTISDPAIQVKTATEIKISRQRTYVTIVGTQKALQTALETLIYAMDVWATIGRLAPAGAYSVSMQFDDSVLVDKNAQFSQDLQLVRERLMGKVEFRMKHFNENEETARAKVIEANTELQAEQEEDLFGGA